MVKIRGSGTAAQEVRLSVVLWVEAREELAVEGRGRQQQCEDETDGLHSGQIPAGLLHRQTDQFDKQGKAARYRPGAPELSSITGRARRLPLFIIVMV